VKKCKNYCSQFTALEWYPPLFIARDQKPYRPIAVVVVVVAVVVVVVVILVVDVDAVVLDVGLLARGVATNSTILPSSVVFNRGSVELIGSVKASEGIRQ